MLPQQRDKIDMSSLSEEEQNLFRLYGKLPNRKDLLANRLKERKYFDSGDYALSKAGRAPKQSVGTTIPNPEMVPHAASSAGANPIQIPHEGGAMSPAHTLGVSPAPHSAAPTSPSHRHRLSMSGGSSGSFPTATGMFASSPTGEPTSSLSREQNNVDMAQD